MNVACLFACLLLACGQTFFIEAPRVSMRNQEFTDRDKKILCPGLVDCPIGYSMKPVTAGPSCWSFLQRGVNISAVDTLTKQRVGNDDPRVLVNPAVDFAARLQVAEELRENLVDVNRELDEEESGTPIKTRLVKRSASLIWAKYKIAYGRLMTEAMNWQMLDSNAFIMNSSASSTPLCARGRLSPVVIGVGYPAAATTTAWSDMNKYIPALVSGVPPQYENGISATNYKERRFFDLFGLPWETTNQNWPAAYSKARDAYQQTWPECLGSHSSRQTGPKMGFEFTPLYLGGGDVVAQRIVDFFEADNISARQAPKFVAVIRSPTERLYSWWRFIMKDSKSPISFRDWVTPMLVTLEACQGKGLTGVALFENCITHEQRGDDYNKLGAIFTGLYAAHLTAWLRYFDPSQFYFAPFRSYLTNPSHYVRGIAKWLNVSTTVSDWAMPSEKNKHEPIDDMDADLFERLVNVYRQPNREFRDLLKKLDRYDMPDNLGFKDSEF